MQRILLPTVDLRLFLEHDPANVAEHISKGLVPFLSFRFSFLRFVVEPLTRPVKAVNNYGLGVTAQPDEELALVRHLGNEVRKIEGEQLGKFGNVLFPLPCLCDAAAKIMIVAHVYVSISVLNGLSFCD